MTEKGRLRLRFKELAREFFARHDATALKVIHGNIAQKVAAYIKSRSIKVRKVAIYEPMRYELPVRDILLQVPALATAEFLYPEVDGDSMTFASEPDFVIVPGLFVDAVGNRLGRGRGYYDRYLAQSKLTTPYHLFLGYDFQFVSHVPSEEHDALVSVCGGA